MINSGNYICIEGNIGTGKTTLCELIQQRDQCKLILEEFADNPFLKYFYEDPERYSFTVELFFLTERHKQLKNDLLQPDLFITYYLSDYCLIKSLLFAKNNLKQEEEFKLYNKLYNSLSNDFRKPDRILYIHRPINIIQKQIKARGRSYELEIPDAYLQSIEEMYFQYFQTLKDTPCIILHCGEVDYINNPNAFEQIYQCLHKEFSTGIHHLEVKM